MFDGIGLMTELLTVIKDLAIKAFQIGDIKG